MKKYILIGLSLIICICVLLLSVNAFAAEIIAFNFVEYDPDLNNNIYHSLEFIPHGTYVLHAGDLVSDPFVYDVGDDFEVDDQVFFDINIGGNVYPGYFNVRGQIGDGCAINIWIVEDDDYNAPISEYLPLSSSQSVYLEPYSPSVLSPIDSFFGVVTGVGDWLSMALVSVVTLFYADSGLTLLGVLAVAALALDIVLVLFFLVFRWLTFRSR